MNLFDLDSPPVRALTVVFNLILLNWLFLFCSIPIITMGASLTAMHHVVLEMIRKQDPSIAKSFFRAFKGNFRQATLTWLVYLALGTVLVVDYQVGSELLPGAAWTLVLAAMSVLAILWLLTWPYVFPMQARYDNPIPQTIKNAFLVSIANLPNSLIMVAITLAVPYISWRYENTIPAVVLLSMFVLFSGVAYLNDLLVNRIFLRMFPEEREKQNEWNNPK